MNILFHYHIPVVKKEDRLYTLSFFGVFIDALANGCKLLTLIAYEPTSSEYDSLDYKIQSTNVQYIGIGLHDSVPKRLLRLYISRKSIDNYIKKSDVFLLRAPTPFIVLLPFLNNRRKILLYLVGDYIEGTKGIKFGFLKRNLIIGLAYLIDIIQKRHVSNRMFLANSELLMNKMLQYSDKGVLVKTTTLSSGDFYKKEFEPTKNLKILFTGRIDESKGIFEILEACSILMQKGYDVEFHIAGLLVKGKENIIEELISRCKTLNIPNIINYHGLKKVGEELNSVYRLCDIYVIASKSDFEGFPRTLWEAMANSLPIISTKVGSIPYYIKNYEQGYLIDTYLPDEIADAILIVINQKEQTNERIKNAYDLAKTNTLEVQAKLLVNTIALFKKTIVNDK